MNTPAYSSKKRDTLYIDVRNPVVKLALFKFPNRPMVVYSLYLSSRQTGIHLHMYTCVWITLSTWVSPRGPMRLDISYIIIHYSRAVRD